MRRKLLELEGTYYNNIYFKKYVGNNISGKAQYDCICYCGKPMKKKIASDILSGRIKSCGCLSKAIDETGKIYHGCEALNSTNKRSGSNIVWKFKCHCGNIFEQNIAQVKNGNTKSCGCLAIESARKTGRMMAKNISGQKFGLLTAIRPTNERSGNSVIWEFKCDCGNILKINNYYVKRGRITNCGCIKTESYVALECKKYFVKYYYAIPEYRECINPKTKHLLPYDIYIPSYKCYIEIQGQQHYEESARADLSYQKYKDKIKKKHAKKNGIFVEVDIRKHTTAKSAIQYIEDNIGI